VVVRPGAGAGENGSPGALGKRFDDAGMLTNLQGMEVNFSDNFIHTYLRLKHWNTSAKQLKRLSYLKQKGEEIVPVLKANGGQASIMELVFKNQKDFMKVIKDDYDGCTYLREDYMLLKFAILDAAGIQVPRLVGQG
jgi:hypothetical protein